MLRRDIIGIYLPAAYVMLGISNLIVCKCASEPTPQDVTGPSGSSMVCVFYYLFHLFLWIPVGIVLVFFQWLRYRTSSINTAKVYYQASSGDNMRHLVGGLVGGFFVLVSTIILADLGGALSIFIASSAMSTLPALFFFIIGSLATMHKRRRIEDADKTSPSNGR
jgi:hypothetical protein